jgi:hypothetical protein
MKNIHVIQTDKPSRLIYNDANQLCYQSNKSFKNDRKNRKKFNIYITSDDEIKEGDWVLCGGISLLKVKKERTYDAIKLVNNDFETKKIILTTDQDLIKDGVQAIDYEFLEWFVKNPSCDEVEVLFACRGIDGLKGLIGEYKIIIPKEEPKEEPRILTVEAFNKAKISYKELPKFGTKEFNDLSSAYFGGKPKQKIMYSETEVLQLLLRLQQTESYDNLYNWFEQFKKK